jgi:hypothetical protein
MELTSPAGDFAHVKDHAELPWQIGRAWKALVKRITVKKKDMKPRF